MQHEEIKQIVEEIIKRITNTLEDFNYGKIGERYSQFKIADDVLLYVDMLEYFFLDERHKSVGIGLYKGHHEIEYRKLAFYSIEDVEDCMLSILTTHADLFEEVA